MDGSDQRRDFVRRTTGADAGAAALTADDSVAVEGFRDGVGGTPTHSAPVGHAEPPATPPAVAPTGGAALVPSPTKEEQERCPRGEWRERAERAKALPIWLANDGLRCLAASRCGGVQSRAVWLPEGGGLEGLVAWLVACRWGVVLQLGVVGLFVGRASLRSARERISGMLCPPRTRTHAK